MEEGFRLDSDNGGAFMVADDGFCVHENCAGCSIAYILSQCNENCPNTDCDGSEANIITTPALSNLVKSDIGKVVTIFGSTECWEVTEGFDDTGAVSVTKTNTYDDCEECCDECYKCGACEFHPDSIITASFKTGQLQICENDNCTDCSVTGATVYVEDTYTRTLSQCQWYNPSVTVKIINSLPEVCSGGFDETPFSTTTRSVSIRKNCTSGFWEFSVAAGSWNPLDATSVWGNLGTDCSGGSDIDSFACHFQNAFQKHVCEWWDSSIVVSNNSCESPGP